MSLLIPFCKGGRCWVIIYNEKPWVKKRISIIYFMGIRALLEREREREREETR